MWIFGYGSLIWKVDFPIQSSQPGYIKGYARRFWQSSNDHRGTPENPGRVVTLIPTDQLSQFPDETDEGVCFGMAYKIPDHLAEEVFGHLDYREKNGYTIHKVDVYDIDSNEPVIHEAIVYIGTLDNEAFVGPSPVPQLANHIFRSIGPSGPNIDYLMNLCQALRTTFPNQPLDLHLSSLEQEVIRLKQLEKIIS